MDLRHLKTFVHVVEAGGFSRAAAVLDVAQPTLSRQIALLEAAVGQRVLRRTGRGALPTEAGALLLVHARAMLELAERATSELRELDASPAGRVVVGLSPRIALALGAPLIQRFRARFPRAVLNVSEGLSAHLHEWLVAGRLDLALLFDPPASPQLACSTLLRESMLLVASRTAASLPPRVGLGALADYPVVLPGAPNAIRSLVEAALQSRRVRLNVVAEVGAVHTVLTLVAQGAAYTVLPQSALAQWPERDRLQCAPIGPPAIRNTLVLAMSRTRPATRLVRETSALLVGLDYAAFSAGRDQPPAPEAG